ncbi:hypothetical protein AJ79_03138 [Helicocarpus griseus UAMH5409]|uniref:Uncharacterized protein n=1 Tax=Helicocarpus griseus UAMH5409 TaxID=1447875 RepID=A0A2B7XYM7_9EURO|nr:hypothetical protein AJ79_03138 [Helicocarpus griseus UAMH5409]
MASIEKQILELCSSGNEVSLRPLLDSYEMPLPPYFINQMLAAATASKHVGLVKYLLSRYPDNPLSPTAICAATDVASIPIFQIFYEKDPSIVHMSFEREGTPLALALFAGRPLDFISYLLESCKADPNQATSIIPLPLAGAASGYGGSTEAVALLLKHGAKVQHSGALCMASLSGYTEVAKLLFEMGATPDTDARNDGIPDITGTGSALYVAAHEGHLGMVELLLKHGADRDARSREGKTARDVAGEKGYTQIVEALDAK